MVWGATPRTRTDVEGRKLESGGLASTRTRPVPQGVGRADGRAVVIGCNEPLARGGGARHTIRADWLVHIGFAGGHFEMRRFAVGGLAGRGGCHGVVTSGAKHGGTQGDALRQFLQISGRGGTGWDG